MMEWEATSSQKGKKPIVDKTPNSYLFFSFKYQGASSIS